MFEQRKEAEVKESKPQYKMLWIGHGVKVYSLTRNEKEKKSP